MNANAYIRWIYEHKVHEIQNRSGIYRYFEFPTLASCVRSLSLSHYVFVSAAPFRFNPIDCYTEFQRNGLRIRLECIFIYCIFMFRSLNIFGFTKLGREYNCGRRLPAHLPFNLCKYFLIAYTLWWYLMFAVVFVMWFFGLHMLDVPTAASD